MAMRFEAPIPANLQREIPKTEKLAKQLVDMRAIGSVETEAVLQSLIQAVYAEATRSLTNPLPIGKVSNIVRGKILTELNNHADVSPYYVLNTTKRAVKQALEPKNQAS
ncbi:MAG: hypothetical protein WA001_02130 [Patescibacteria group bacterium]